MRSSRSCRCRRGYRSRASAWTRRATRRSWRGGYSEHDAGPTQRERDGRTVISRYTRDELGRLWSDEARMESWRRVEVAACEELPELLGAGEGPTSGELEAIRK